MSRGFKHTDGRNMGLQSVVPRVRFRSTFLEGEAVIVVNAINGTHQRAIITGRRGAAYRVSLPSGIEFSAHIGQLRKIL